MSVQTLRTGKGVQTSFGIRNNKTYLLNQYKQQRSLSKPKFKKKRIEENSYTHSLLKTDYTCIEIQPLTGNQQPWWIIIYEETQEKISQIQEQQKELKKLQDKRILIQFEDSDVIDKQIHEITTQCTRKIQECEKNIQQLQTVQNENDYQAKIRMNIQKQLATQLQEVTKNLRNQQTNMVNQLKKVNNGYSANFLQLSAEKMLEMKDYDNQAAMQQNQELLDLNVSERDQEINSLLENINQLGQIFKTMGQLVVEQGTILDRIDFNIEDALQQTKQANVQLDKANVSDKKSFGQKCIKIEIAAILVLLIFLFIKYTY